MVYKWQAHRLDIPVAPSDHESSQFEMLNMWAFHFGVLSSDVWKRGVCEHTKIKLSLVCISKEKQLLSIISLILQLNFGHLRNMLSIVKTSARQELQQLNKAAGCWWQTDFPIWRQSSRKAEEHFWESTGRSSASHL